MSILVLLWLLVSYMTFSFIYLSLLVLFGFSHRGNLKMRGRRTYHLWHHVFLVNDREIHRILLFLPLFVYIIWLLVAAVNFNFYFAFGFSFLILGQLITGLLSYSPDYYRIEGEEGKIEENFEIRTILALFYFWIKSFINFPYYFSHKIKSNKLISVISELLQVMIILSLLIISLLFDLLLYLSFL
jgi:hypothetical protein